MRLQKLSLPPFSGDVIGFVRFSAQFETEIDKINLDDVSKLNYLLSLTKGKPRNDISGLPHNSEGYKEAKRILQSKYGKDCIVFKTLVLELESLPSIRHIHQKREINDFSQRFSKIVRTLTTMGKITSVDGTVHSVFARLGPLRENLAATNDDWETWSLSKLAEELERYVDRNNLNSDKWSSEYKYDGHRQSDRHGEPDRHGQANRYKNTTLDRDNKSEGRGQSKYGKDKLFYNGDNKYQDNKRRCIFCNYTNHEAKDCLKVLDLAKRRDIIKTKNLCYVCLKHGHLASKCRSTLCSKCNRKHNIVICDEEKTTIPSRNETADVVMTSLQKGGPIHSTARVEINGIRCRLMIDTGATKSYICTDLLHKLHIKPCRTEFCNIEQLYNGVVRKKVEIYKLTMKSLFSDFKVNIEVNNSGKDVITHLPNYNISLLKSRYSKLRDLEFSDENASENNLPVHILLGMKDYITIKTTKAPIISQDKGPIVAEFTKLGWVLSGGINLNSLNHDKAFLLSSEEQFERMTKLDILGVTDPEESKEDFHVEFLENLKQNRDGRYIANLPWKKDIVGLANNKQLALCRLKKNTERLEKLNKIQE